jgi:hypothetical protein
LSSVKAERCGLCAARADAKGLYCRVPLRLEDNCRDNCGKEILLMSAAKLGKKGYTPAADGALAAGKATFNVVALKAAIERAQKKRGVDPMSFHAAAVATCRQ